MTEELQELEPLDDQPTAPRTPAAAVAEGPDGGAVAVVAGVPILGAPAYNPAAGKEYFRFLFAGVLMFIGCMMPWGATPYESVGYETFGGAITLFIASGLIWSWWGSIAVNRFKGAALLWVVASLIPLLAQVNEVLNRPGEITVNRVITQQEFDDGDFSLLAPGPVDGTVFVRAEKGDYGIGDFFGDYTSFTDTGAQTQAIDFLYQFGPGRLIVLLAALWAEFAMAMAIFGGAKHNKAQKQSAAASRAAKTGAGKAGTGKADAASGDAAGGASKGRGGSRRRR